MSRKTLARASAALSLCVAVLLLSAAARSRDLAEPQGQQGLAAKAATNPLLGTWRLVSMRYGDAKEFTDAPKDSVHLKHVTATHFEWVHYDAATKRIERAAGGRYTLQGDKYTEHLEYALGDEVLPMIGKDQVFTDKVEGDMLNQSGNLSTGLRIAERWERVKGDAAGGEHAAKDAGEIK